jgi:glycosyltransferase involved in cell wall biosynthesis
MCIEKKHFADHLPVFQQPQEGISNLINTICFHLNLSLPFYRKVIQKEHPDIIHAHFGFDGYRMFGVANETNTPLVVSFHGSDVSKLPTEFDWKRRYKKLAANAQAFTAISELMKSELIELGFPSEQITVIRTGVDVHKFAFKEKFEPDKNIMMAGRMVEKKGFKYALQAIHILKNNGRPVNIDFYGDGPLRGDLEEQAANLDIENQVQFHRYVPKKRIRRELQKHSVMLAPSITASNGDKEGLPVTILEAMASGVPVIASDHSAIPEAIHHRETGLLIPEGKSEAIATALAQLLDREIAVNEIRENARKLIEKKHAIKHVVEATEELYTKTIANYEK